MENTVLVVEDDELSREVLRLQLSGAGYRVWTAEEGAKALSLLRAMTEMPGVVLSDLQMPGITGSALATELRAVCGASTVLLAMSASLRQDSAWRGFDGFLMKPFTMDAFGAAVRRVAFEEAALPQTETPAGPACLDKELYGRLAASMPAAQVAHLYELCLSDAEARVAAMRRAAEGEDDVTFRREAHTIKGSCSMVGAVELQNLAGSLEDKGLATANYVATLEEMAAACGRLRRMLFAQEQAPQAQ